MEEVFNAAEILRKNGVIFDRKNTLSQFGGIAPFLAFLEKGQFKKRFEVQFGYHRSRTMLQFILGLICGARTMVHIGNLCKDPLIKKYLGNPVEEAQLGRDVRSFSREQIEALHDLVVSISIFDFAKRVKHKDQLIFDVDSTAVEKYGYQEGVELGYVGKDDPEKCYQYFLIRLHNRNTFLYGTIRGGAAHSQNDFCGYLARFLPTLKSRWNCAWRADAGFFNEEAFDLFSENDATCFIKAPMSESRLALATTSPDLVWQEVEDAISYASRDSRTARGTIYREIFKRTKKKDLEEQLSLDASISPYRYDCLATNDLSIEDQKAFEFYNGRANIENNIRELKNDYHLGKIITDEFNANDVLTQLTLLTYLLVTHFKNECLPPNMSRFQLSTLRTHLLGIAGRFILSARRSMIRIQNVFSDENIYARIYQKIIQLQSWVLDPPILIST